MKKRGIAYNLVEGSDKSVNLVFVPGSGSNKNIFNSLIGELPKYNCYSIDMPGHGDSDTKEFSIDCYINSVVDFVSDLDNVVIIGHSLGGTICVGVAAKQLENVKGCVLLSTASSFPKLNKDFLAKIHNGVVDMEFLMAACGHLDNPDVVEALGTLDPLEQGTMIQDFLIDEVVNLDDSLKDVKVPSLIITGGAETLVLVEYSEFLQKGISNSKLVILEGGKHMVFISEKVSVAKHIEDFIGTL